MSGLSTKERIVRTAIDLFAEKGYESASMREIARGTGIKASSIYNHFSSKEEILLVLLDIFRDLIEKQYGGSVSIRLKGKKATVEELMGYLFFAFPEDDFDLYIKMLKILSRELLAHSKIKEFFNKEIVDAVYGISRDTLLDLIDRDAIPPCDAHKMGAIIYAIQIAFSTLRTYDRSEMETGVPRTGMFPLLETIILQIVEGTTQTLPQAITGR